MSLRGWTAIPITNPRGQWSLISGTRQGTPDRATLARNVRFIPGRVYSREGTTNVLAAGGKITAIFNWISPSDNLLVYQQGSAAYFYDLTLATGPSLLIANVGAARSMSFADLGPRLYMAAWDTNGAGTIQGRVFDGTFTGPTPDVDTLFRGPLQVTSFTATDGGAGNCTQGTHYLAFVFQSRSGFAGQPSPVNGGGVFSPISITLTGANRTINVSITLNTPADAGGSSAIYPLMTRANNPSQWYFVPGVSAILPPSAPGWTQTFSISVSDSVLGEDATPADNNFNFVVQDASGNGPFSPSCVCAYGSRMCYADGVNVWVSNQNAPQEITADQNLIHMPNQRKVPAVFPLNSNLYLTGDKWTGSCSDNGDVPATWPQPQLVSDSIGAPFPGCIEYRTKGSYVWIAAESGLYVFDGAFPVEPITYFQSEWKQINWAAAYCIQIADDVVLNRCYVALPMGNSTEPTMMMVVDYTNGLTYDTCDISFDVFNTATFSAIRNVKETATNRTALWIGPSSAGHFVHLDPSVHSDDGAGFTPIWQTGLLIEQGMSPVQLVRVGPILLWVRGSGALTQLAKRLDGLGAMTLPRPLLSAAPGEELLTRLDMGPVDNFTLQYSTSGGASEWFDFSGVTPYIKPFLTNR